MSTRLIVCAVGMLVVSACAKNKSTTGESAQEAMGEYAEGFNVLIDDPKRMVNEYFDEIPPEGPAPGSKPHLFPHDPSNEIKKAKEAFVKAKQVAPASISHLAPLADGTIVAIEKVSSTFDAAVKYYAAENYKDDQYARGKELHAQMVAESTSFNEALAKLEAGLSTIEDVQATEELKKYAGAKSYSYWFRFHKMEAKKFVTAVEEAETPEQLAQLGTAFGPIEAAYNDLDAFAKAKGDSADHSFALYVKTASDFHATGTKLVRLAKDVKGESPELDRAVEELVNRYNNLVQGANSLFEVEAANGLK